MDWDLTLEKLRREAFRPTVPPPVRMPRWAVAALLGAGLTLSGAACDRGGSGDVDTASDMGRVHVEYGAPMPPELQMQPPVPEPLYAAPAEPPPPVEEYRAPPMREAVMDPPAPLPEMKSEPVDPPMNMPLYSHPPMRQIPDPVKARPMYGLPPMPPPQSMYGGPAMDDF